MFGFRNFTGFMSQDQQGNILITASTVIGSKVVQTMLFDVIASARYNLL